MTRAKGSDDYDPIAALRAITDRPYPAKSHALASPGRRGDYHFARLPLSGELARRA